MNFYMPKKQSKEEGKGRNLGRTSFGALEALATRDCSLLQTDNLMEVILERTNMTMAFERVIGNKGAPGVDGITTEELKAYLQEHWLGIKIALMEGRYKPSPVRKVEIPKPGGKGMRQLGIPTVVDRLIQQAIHQILSPIFEKEFSDNSYGFRPGRSAHQAILKAQGYIVSGKEWVVDIDLEKFFDRVNHDILMSKVARKIKDKRLLLLIRRFLQAGIMAEGIVSQRVEGTPQGGPLSPLLSNIMLTELDEEIERRGLCFCRYADDCNIYVRTQRQGERVMKSIKKFLNNRLRLKVNEEKSQVAQHWQRKFLGYSTTKEGKPRRKIAEASIEKLKDKLRKKFRQGRGQSIGQVIKNIIPLMRGWMNYFKLTETDSCLESLTCWIRHKLRAIIWRQLKRSRTRIKALIQQGITRKEAWILVMVQNKGPWRSSGSYVMNRAFPNWYFGRLGFTSLPSLKKKALRLL
jgi:RNA-directed DNA polymerase